MVDWQRSLSRLRRALLAAARMGMRAPAFNFRDDPFQSLEFSDSMPKGGHRLSRRRLGVQQNRSRSPDRNSMLTRVVGAGRSSGMDSPSRLMTMQEFRQRVRR